MIPACLFSVVMEIFSFQCNGNSKIKIKLGREEVARKPMNLRIAQLNLDCLLPGKSFVGLIERQSCLLPVLNSTGLIRCFFALFRYLFTICAQRQVGIQ